MAPAWPLSFRVDNEGGPVCAPSQKEVEALRGALDAGTDRGLILLIHGYNNTRAEAEASYRQFLAAMQAAAGSPQRPLADNRVVAQVFWPGDADWGLAKVLFYMWSIGQACRAAGLLAEVLRALAQGRPQPLGVQIVAHSMGCRLSCELAKALATGNDAKVRVDKLALMAAAVPTFKLEPPQPLRRGLERTMAARPMMSLYSPDDWVLAYAFPPGQTLAPGEEGFFPTALGHEHWSSCGAPANLQQQHIKGAGHSDYWAPSSDRQAGVAREANGKIRDFIGFVAPATREVAATSSACRRIEDGRKTAVRKTAIPSGSDLL